MKIVAATQIELVSFGTGSGFAGRVCDWRIRQRFFATSEVDAAQRGCDVFGNFVLNGEKVVGGSIKSLRPAVIAGARFNELNGNSQAVVRFADASLEERAHLQVAADFADVCSRTAELERSSAGYNAQAIHVRESVDQFLGEALAEIVLITVRTHVGE